MWLHCIMYHTCQMIFSFPSLLRALHVYDYVCVRIYVCVVNLNQGHEASEVKLRSYASVWLLIPCIDRPHFSLSRSHPSESWQFSCWHILELQRAGWAYRVGGQGTRESLPAAESDRIHEGIMTMCVSVNTHCRVFSLWPLMLNKF